MSYTLTLQCGCTVYVATHPTTGIPHARILEQRSPTCPVRKHEAGLHLALWELLPDPAHRNQEASFEPPGSEPPVPRLRRKAG